MLHPDLASGLTSGPPATPLRRGGSRASGNPALPRGLPGLGALLVTGMMGALPGPAEGQAAAPKVVQSPHGAVAAQSVEATETAVRVLEEGGTAVDAAVAAAFALAVTEPSNSGIGGRTNILVRTASGEVHGLDGTTVVPRNYPGEQDRGGATYGYRTVGIPGTVAALTGALERWGTWSLERAMAPAIRFAEEGFPLSEQEADRMRGARDELQEFEGSRTAFLREDGTPYAAGDRFVQPVLAETLRTIAEEGPDVFYRGPIAERIARDFAAHGGYLTGEDLESYELREQTLVTGEYRGYEIVAAYLPTSGANTIQALHMLEEFDLAEMDEAEYAAILAQVLAIVLDDQLMDLARMGPPSDFPRRANAEEITSREFARERAAEVRVPGRDEPLTGSPPRDEEPFLHDGETSHVSVVDPAGNAVALTQSIGPGMGSKVATEGLGFLYAATMGWLTGTEASAGIRQAGPGDRATARHTPMFLLRDGELRYVIGGSGARRIVTGTVQSLSRSIDRGLSFPEALAAPRLHVEPAQPGVIQLEIRSDGRGWSPDVVSFLEEFGFQVREGSYFGRVQGVRYDPASGEFIGVSEPRGDGAAGAPRH